MKHLLILLISILLLSSPVIGQETGVLYLYETSSDFVWKSVGSKELQPKYEGEIKNGKMETLLREPFLTNTETLNTSM